MTSNRTYISNISRVPFEKLSFRKLPHILHHTDLPSSVDLRPKMPPVRDQSSLGACSSFALIAGFEYDDPSFQGSHLFLYYNERVIENDVEIDGGAFLSDGILALQKYGLCSEATWPYDISKFVEKPPESAYTEALNHQALEVKNIHQDINSMKNSLVNGFPFVVGIQLFQEFESEHVAKTGIVPMPTRLSKSIGGHAVIIVAYTPEHWIAQNSWSSDWGDHGFFYLPYAYLLDSSLCSDLWSILKVEK